MFIFKYNILINKYILLKNNSVYTLRKYVLSFIFPLTTTSIKIKIPKIEFKKSQIQIQIIELNPKDFLKFSESWCRIINSVSKHILLTDIFSGCFLVRC